MPEAKEFVDGPRRAREAVTRTERARGMSGPSPRSRGEVRALGQGMEALAGSATVTACPSRARSGAHGRDQSRSDRRARLRALRPPRAPARSLDRRLAGGRAAVEGPGVRRVARAPAGPAALARARRARRAEVPRS